MYVTFLVLNVFLYRYATHIFDGLDDWPTHLHYLTNGGNTGWQGELHELDMYREMRAKGEPSPMLRIAEKWLRAELVERKAKGSTEKALGEAARSEVDPLQHPDKHQGGYSAGRANPYAGVGHVI